MKGEARGLAGFRVHGGPRLKPAKARSAGTRTGGDPCTHPSHQREISPTINRAREINRLFVFSAAAAAAAAMMGQPGLAAAAAAANPFLTTPFGMLGTAPRFR